MCTSAGDTAGDSTHISVPRNCLSRRVPLDEMDSIKYARTPLKRWLRVVVVVVVAAMSAVCRHVSMRLPRQKKAKRLLSSLWD